MAVRKREDEVFPNAAGIDVGGSSHWVAVPPRSSAEPVREFGAMTDDLNAMATWLIACGVDTVALESTGVYWIPIGGHIRHVALAPGVRRAHVRRGGKRFDFLLIAPSS